METLKLEKILNQREQMPRRQRALCEYLLQNTNEADGLTAKQLAQKSGVGEATIFRFLKEQGYPSYGEFRRELHQYAGEPGLHPLHQHLPQPAPLAVHDHDLHCDSSPLISLAAQSRR